MGGMYGARLEQVRIMWVGKIREEGAYVCSVYNTRETSLCVLGQFMACC